MIDGREALRKTVLAACRYSGAARLSAPLLGGRGAILMLHSVASAPVGPLGVNDHLRIAPAFLDALLADMKRRGFAFVTMDEMVEALAKPGLARLAAVTLDDGYRDNLTEALPVFEAHDASFLVYVAPGLIDGTVRPWWEVVAALAAGGRDIRLPDGRAIAGTPRQRYAQLFRYLESGVEEGERQSILGGLGGRDVATSAFLDWDGVRLLASHRLGSIGAHTLSHANLARLDAQRALAEMVGSADRLAAETGRRPRHFAYPFGHEGAVGEREAALAREAGFATAVTTRHGTVQTEHADHLHALPRISVNGRYQKTGYVAALLSGLPMLIGARRRVVAL